MQFLIVFNIPILLSTFLENNYLINFKGMILVLKYFLPISIEVRFENILEICQFFY